jgi:maleylpyruvate isomerase
VGRVVLDGSMATRRTADSEVAGGLLGEASARLLRTVDRFEADDWAGASALPGWSRAHVVAHLALNGEGITRVLRALVAGDHPAAMYDSDKARDADIGDLAAGDPDEIRTRLMGASTLLEDAVAAVPDDRWTTVVERTPGGRTLRADSLPGMRLRELEIHHVDLDAGYTTRDWTEGFAILLLTAMTKRLDPPERFEVRPLDVGRTWVLGPDGGGDAAVVTGPAADVGWWLTGRPAPDTVSCSRGELPSIEGW